MLQSAIIAAYPRKKTRPNRIFSLAEMFPLPRSSNGFFYVSSFIVVVGEIVILNLFYSPYLFAFIHMLVFVHNLME